MFQEEGSPEGKEQGDQHTIKNEDGGQGGEGSIAGQCFQRAAGGGEHDGGPLVSCGLCDQYSSFRDSIACGSDVPGDLQFADCGAAANSGDLMLLIAASSSSPDWIFSARLGDTD